MKQILKTLILSIGLVFIYTESNAEQKKTLWIAQGPPVVCGTKQETRKVSKRHDETEIMVLQEYNNDQAKSYFILYRNIKSGSWTIVGYNLRNASPDISCILTAGMVSYILPDIELLSEALNRQKDGLTKQEVVPLTEESEDNTNRL